MTIPKIQDILQGISVLCVHENISDNNILRYTLPDFGLRAEVIDDAKKGWEMYLKLRPHFMIIGIESGHSEGLELFRQIRERDPIMPIIVITKNLSQEDMLSLVNQHVHYILTENLTRKNIRKALISCTSFFEKRESAYLPIKDGLNYYPAQSSLHYKGTRVQLTQKERHLLLLLLHNRGRIVYYEEIEYKVWIGSYMSLSALKSTVKNIHAKSPFKFITNYSKEGYGISEEI